MTRIGTSLLGLPALLAACLAAGCGGNGGAISVRWRVIDLSTGADYDPRTLGNADGACDCTVRGLCPAAPAPAWRVDRVRLDLQRPDGTAEPIDAALVEFPCSQREATTPFELPPGTFAISLVALGPTSGGRPAAYTPSPAVRTIKRAEVVNLNIVEVGVNPQK